MTNVSSHRDALPLQVSLDLLIARHGVWRVARTAIAALVTQRRPRRFHARHLPNRLRADIGLPPIVDPPPPALWNTRW